MSKILEDLKYTKTHEWVKVVNGIASVGITDHAQDNLGSIVYLEVGEVGDSVLKDTEFGVVESVKAASDLLAPVSGVIKEINEELIAQPEKLNEDPYNNWIIKVEINNDEELNDLLDYAQYEVECK